MSLARRHPQLLDERHSVGGYREFSPRPASRRWIEYLWTCSTPGTARSSAPHRVVADPGVSLAFSCHRHKGKAEGASLRLFGPVESRRLFESDASFEMVCVRPKLEWLPFLLGAQPQDHVDAKHDFLEVDPGIARPVLARVSCARSMSEALALLESELVSLAEQSRRSPHQRALHAMEILRRTAGTVPLRRVAQHLGCTPRSLRRWIREAAGVPPKRYSRLLRFQAVLAASDPLAAPDWASLACRFHYFDQSHLIRDFQEFAWSSPSVVHRERWCESAFSNHSPSEPTRLP